MNIGVTLATVPAILAIVNLLKDFGVSGKWSMLAAVTVGVALATGEYFLATYGVYHAVASGLLLGLGAAGLYDAARMGTEAREC